MVDQNSQFYAILTNVGAAKQANADALGIAWKITQMGVGDANGTDPTPSANQTKLLNEWRRAPLNQLKVDDKNSAIIIAEQVIPADVGGRWIREIALYDADGDMIAVANCAPTFKPLLSQGSGRTQIVRMNLVVSSASNVQLKIDPSVVLATREWVTEELARQDFKHSVLAATTGAITLSGLQGIDGVALPAGARVLVKNQAAAKDNGLYLAASGAWTRCSDADSSTKVTPGLLVHVEQGSVNGDSAWQLVTDGLISVGVTALAFEMAYGRTGVIAGTYRSVTVDPFGRVTASSNPTTVAGYGLIDVYTKAQIDQLLTMKASLASPALTGTPTAPTASAGTNTTQLATTAFVRSAITALVGASPAALDTLNELALALGNDPNFSATITAALSTKAPLASPALTGVPTGPTAAAGTSNTQLATTAFVQANGLPVGSVIHVCASTPPAGFMKANGIAVSRSTYAALFAVIGTTFGAGNGSSTFNLPDLRGEFVRGLDDGRNLDASRVLGSVQAGQNLSHTHAATATSAGAHIHPITGTASSAGGHAHTFTLNKQGSSADHRVLDMPPGRTSSEGTAKVSTDIAGEHTHAITAAAASAGDHTHNVTITANGGSEARPRNVALLACIKF
ncbi:phage tail protein [Pseudomonas urmiensis]|uniref:phage tail-collar fiber domain-containing protein n=1 Tax=Pseudomonas urmiensis TaxID=2745493 RepID=UPI003CA685D2